MTFSRRGLLQLGALAASSSNFWVREASAQPDTTRYKKIFQELDRFVERYMRTMNAPGMTLVLADREGVQRLVSYGFGDLERQRRIQDDELFHIGSITKSFLALALLQLHEQGKLDFDRPIRDYLPWLHIQSSFAPITVHHLLTHTSGLPRDSEVFPSDPAQAHLAAYAPGQRFQYSNTAYKILGHLAWTLDGRELPQIFRSRIFEPLGMSQSEPVINFDSRERTVKSYSPFLSLSDRPSARHAKLCEAPMTVYTEASGCIAATARDMGAYIRMIANHGRGPHVNLISPQSFERLTAPHIKTEHYGPNGAYGYGLVVDTIEGHKTLRHTGGMVSFMSSLMVDIDEGVGGFASINAQQGYRPNPVVQHAIQLMRARRSGEALPVMPPLDIATRVDNAADYSGVFQSSDGRKLEFVNDGSALYLRKGERRITLERTAEEERFLAIDRTMGRFPLVFGRKQTTQPLAAGTGAVAAVDKDEARKLPIAEVSWGGDWYINAVYDGPRTFDYPKAWASYTGHYRIERPGGGSLRVVLLKGKLVLDGITPLEAEGDLFRLRDTPDNADWIRFGEVVNGKCMRLKFSGTDLWRVQTA